MKTAVLYSGQARSFAACWPTHWWHVLRHLPDPHVFVHVDDDAQAPDMARVKERIAAEKVFSSFANAPADLWVPPDTATYGAAFWIHPDLGRNSRQWWHWQEVWKLMLREERKLDFEFTLFVRMRPDAYFIGWTPPAQLPDYAEIYLPWWARWGGENDRFAVMGRGAAEVYCNLLTDAPKILRQGGAFLAEAMLADQLKLNGVRIRHHDAEFARQRMNGHRAPPEYNQRELYQWMTELAGK